ncbi:MAG: HAD family hydrolase [Planctomycetaceae bacterium]|nr:MAG: HAD family hydrolase [Planctomycetaceae bacterium]
MSRFYVLLDRDGTLNVDRHYLADPDLLELLPGTVEGLSRLQSLGCGLIVVTNQSGIGRGLITPRQLAEVHRRFHQILAKEQIMVDAVYICPHRPEDCCACRKPRPGLAIQAARDFGFDLSECFLIGNSSCDIALGQRVGATTVLVSGSAPRKSPPNRLPLATIDRPRPPDFVVADLDEASRRVENVLNSRRRGVSAA